MLALDTETTTWNKGSAFDPRNYPVCYSYASDAGESNAIPLNDCGPIGRGLGLGILANHLLAHHDLCGFNFKFDYHWFKRLGVDLRNHNIWDVQYGFFLLKRQNHKWPSLEEVATELLGEHKIDTIKLNYWDKGINTDAIPWDELKNYAIQDAELTLKLCQKLQEMLPPEMIKLWKLAGQDLHVLAEMEWNGLKYDRELCEQRAEETEREIEGIRARLGAIYPNVPINFGSNEHLSAFLYGGVVREAAKEHVGFFKTGARAGQPKYRNIEIEHELPRLFTPLPRSELQKDGYFKTDEPTLRKLKCGRQAQRNILADILKLAELEKLLGTYYRGIPAIATEQNWEGDILHSQLHQVSVVSGRLSSSKPNQQNLSGEVQDIIVSRFPS